MRLLGQAWRVWFTVPRWLRFLGAGFVNTLFGYLVFLLLLATGSPYPASLLGATVMGILFNFFTTGRTVFAQSLTPRRFTRFLAAYVLTYVVNLLLLSALVARFGIAPALGQLLCMPPVVLLTFQLMSRWVFCSETIDESANQKTN